MNNNTPQPENLISTRYEQTLEYLYRQTEIPQTLTWANVQARRNERAQPIAINGARHRVSSAKWIRQSPFSVKRIAVIFAAVLLLAILGGTAYATGVFDPILTTMLQGYHSGDQGTQTLLDKGLLTTLNQTSKDDGVTGKLELAYADSNNLILGISADRSMLPSTGAGGDWQLIPDVGKVITSDGITLPPMGSEDTGGGATEILGKGKTLIPTNPNSTQLLITFDTGQIQGSPASLHIHAEFSYFCEDTNESKCAPEARAHTLKNPYEFTYDFTVPFHAGHVVTVNKTATSNGKAVTLERIVITPLETRLYIHGLTYFEISPYNGGFANDDTYLIAGDQTYHHLHLKPLGDPTNRQDPHYLDTITAVPSIDVSKQQTWTLHILDPRHGPGWTFPFTV